MSVLIKGMDMPKYNGCYLLTVRYDADGGRGMCVYPLERLGGHDVRDTKFDTPLFPLVPVPTPHGRLIDADALEDYVIALKRDAIHAYEWTGKSGEWSARIGERERFAVMIEDALTIIEAEGEEE